MLSNGSQIHSKQRVGVILAGGKSHRMEQDKSLLPFGGFSTLIEFQYHRLQSFFDQVYISAKKNKFTFEAPIINDSDERSSPLVALASLFEKVPETELFILSVDTPFVSQEVIESLYDASLSSCADVIIARSKQGLQPLCAIYRRTSLSVIQELLDQDKHRLHCLLEKLDTKEVGFREERLFMNLNYPNDYREALALQTKLI